MQTIDKGFVLSLDTYLWVTLCDFRVNTHNFGGNLYLTENRLTRMEMLCAVDNHICNDARTRYYRASSSAEFGTADRLVFIRFAGLWLVNVLIYTQLVRGIPQSRFLIGWWHASDIYELQNDWSNITTFLWNILVVPLHPLTPPWLCQPFKTLYTHDDNIQFLITCEKIMAYNTNVYQIFTTCKNLNMVNYGVSLIQ